MKSTTIRKHTFLMSISFLLAFSNGFTQGVSLPLALKEVIPFNFKALADTPSFRWEDKTDTVWSLFYEGEKFEGKPTEIFAYYASPSTLSGGKVKEEKFPAVVLVHGGGGTAFPVWVREWAQRGYAAIAMDLGGARPVPEHKQETPWSTTSNPLSNGAPDDTDQYKFFSINKDFTTQWQYHAVANIIRAHSLIRSFSGTDTLRTGLTGISWGGYLTNIVCGIEHRFKVAVPVYGCGFLYEKSVWLSRFDSLGLETSKKWIEQWDPSAYVGNAQMPMLFINGTNDFAYDVESWQKTVNLASEAQQLLIHEMVHNHKMGAEPEEIAKFMEDAFTNKSEKPVLEKVKKIGKWFMAKYENGDDITEAQFIYTLDAINNEDRKWVTSPARIDEGIILAEGSYDIKAAYFLTIDGEGIRSSSPVYFN